MIDPLLAKKYKDEKNVIASFAVTILYIVFI